MTEPSQIASNANLIVEPLKQTHYQQVEIIDVGKGIYNRDCNGFVGFVLQGVALANCDLIPKEPSQPRPRAFKYYDYFASLDPASTRGWRRINALTSDRPATSLLGVSRQSRRTKTPATS
jgi:hypothetical protein